MQNNQVAQSRAAWLPTLASNPKRHLRAVASLLHSQSDPNLERAIAASLASQSEAAQSTDGDAPAQQGYGQHCEASNNAVTG